MSHLQLQMLHKRLNGFGGAFGRGLTPFPPSTHTHTHMHKLLNYGFYFP